MGDLIHGFERVYEREIPELKARARRYRHAKTGADVLSILSDDENKVFGISFRTPPEDSTGIAHILEHSVLCGSRKYPVKEPFVELIKGSLHTFLNAFTYPDKTVYPVASQNLQDFYNLVDVYLDAVFHPRLTPQVLQQEGWHYECESPDRPLTYKGVVFNEMKGNYSSPDSVLAETSTQSLYPDTIYRHDSGGDPEAIPSLTFEQFKRFHETYYHPSNARIFFSGDDDPDRRLQILDAVLREFDAARIDAAIPLQPPREKPWRVEKSFAVEPDSPDAGRGMVSVNWLLPDPLDHGRTLALEVLSHMLMGNAAAPLHKALIDSGLGEEALGGGVASDYRQMNFSAGLRGIDPADAGKVEGVILDTLAGLARDGVPRDLVEASMNTLEFSLRENNTGAWPRGLVLFMRALSTWNYGADPADAIAFEKTLAGLKESIRTSPRFFESLIEEHLLRNPHRATVVLKPEPGLEAKRAAREAERLAAAKAALPPGGAERIVEAARALKAAQVKPDDPADLARIPTLQIKDLDPKIPVYPIEVETTDDGTLVWHDLFTNGILYLHVGFDVRRLPARLVPYLPLFGRALLDTGTVKEDFVTLSRRIGRLTGGVGTSDFVSTDLVDRGGVCRLYLRAKGLVSQGPDMLAILGDVLAGARLDDGDRIRQMILEEKSDLEAGAIPSGHQLVGLRLAARATEAGWYSEQTGGFSQLEFIRKLATRAESDWPSVRKDLEEMRDILFRRDHLVCNLTADGADIRAFRPKLEAFLRRIPKSGAVAAPAVTLLESVSEALTAPAQVHFVGHSLNLFQAGYAFHGSALAATKFLNTTWLWERVRVRGGAYGGFARLARSTGDFTFLSYRDPNLEDTLSVYRGAASHLLESEIHADEIRKSVIGAIGDMDPCLLPDAKGYAALCQHLTRDTAESRQKMRDELLRTTVKDVRRFGEAIRASMPSGRTCVLGPESSIKRAAAAGVRFDRVERVL